jgi:hypothetical protein
MNKFAYLTLGLTSLLTVSACSSSSDHAVTREEYDDTAQAIGTTTSSGSGGGDVAAMADVMIMARGEMPLGFTLTADGHVRGSRLGLDYNYALTCKDTAGTTLALCGPTTDRVDVSLTLTGDLATSNLDASLSRQGSWTVTGMQSATTKFDGNGSFDFAATIRSVFRPGVVTTYNFAYDASYDGVLIDSASHQAIGGSASFDASARHMVTGSNNNSDVTFAVAADITFKADHTATLVLDGDQQYSIDLTTGVVVRVSAT